MKAAPSPGQPKTGGWGVPETEAQLELGAEGP